MSDYAGGNADRDEFFAALGRVFQEFRDVSKGYGICDVARLAGMAGADVESRAEIRIGSGGECITQTFNPVTQDWECIYFMAP